MQLTQLPPSPRRPEGRSIQRVRANCGHSVKVTWDNRFPPDQVELEVAVEIWADRPCVRCTARE